MTTTTTIHDYWGPDVSVGLGEDFPVTDKDVTVVYTDPMVYGAVQLRVTDEGVVVDLIDSEGEVVGTLGETWDELGTRVAGFVDDPDRTRDLSGEVL